jgi:hypothetical protein
MRWRATRGERVTPVDRGNDDQLERDLAALRSEPSEDFVGSLAERTAGRGDRFHWSRASFAAAFLTLTLGAFASFGGAGYAASSAASAFDSIVRTSHPASHHQVLKPTSASDEYTTKAAPKVGKAHKAHKAVLKPPTVKPATTVSVAGTGKTLPFTGVSLAATTAIALTFIALGFLLRRRERKQE